MNKLKSTIVHTNVLAKKVSENTKLHFDIHKSYDPNEELKISGFSVNECEAIYIDLKNYFESQVELDNDRILLEKRNN